MKEDPMKAVFGDSDCEDESNIVNFSPAEGGSEDKGDLMKALSGVSDSQDESDSVNFSPVEGGSEDKDLMKAMFGDSDSEDESNSVNFSPAEGGSEDKKVWEEVKGISGLWLCRNFLSPKQQDELLTAIEYEGWFKESSQNQAMRFGDLPEWASKLCGLVERAICCYDVMCQICNISTACPHEDQKGSPFPPELLWREPLFNQMIANSYQPGEGICAHVDLLRFEDGIAIVSLESSCIMHFTHQSAITKGAQCTQQPCDIIQNLVESKTDHNKDLASKIPVLLMPGDLILMSEEARYNWLHEINRKTGYQIWNGEEIPQSRRISITLRRLCQTK